MTFEEFTAARLPAMLRYAAVLTGDQGLAEDVVQEVLVRAYTRWRRITAVDEPERYVRRMITNEYLSWRRRWARITPRHTVTPAASDAPDHPTTHADREALKTELARLPRRQRAVLVLRYYEGLTDAEIADVLGCRPGTVRGYASRALATLRVDLATPELLRGMP